MDKIKVLGARTHNLSNISLTIPRNKLVLLTGLSGSGKSSLAFDTLYAEGQRRYIESLSPYARQFLPLMEKPDVDHITGLPPAISINQKSTSHNPRSTVGTITEIHDYLRLLFSRVGEARCPEHNTPLAGKTVSQIVDSLLERSEGSSLMLLSPIIQAQKGEHANILKNLMRRGYTRARINGKILDLSDLPILEPQKKHTIEVVIDRFKVHSEIAARLAESLEIALSLSCGTVIVTDINNLQPTEYLFSTHFGCPICGYSIQKMEPPMFSFNSPIGACQTCNGLGVEEYFDANQIVKNPSLSLADGAIWGWDKRNSFYFQILQSLAKHYQFDVKVPWNNLGKDIQTTILFGSRNENIELQYVNNSGKTCIYHRPFKGVLNEIEHRYKTTESSALREELAKLTSSRSCRSCGGDRLRREARHVFLDNINLPSISRMSIDNAMYFFMNLKLYGQREEIAKPIIKEITHRIDFLIKIGLNYLTLSRSIESLSGGEAQRIRLASQIGSGLVGVMYVLDEPSIGLHQRDNGRLLDTLFHLRDLGNTVIVVEHDKETIRAADHLIDIGPGAGVHGGQIVAEGSLEKIMSSPKSITGQYMSGKRIIEVPKQRILVDLKKILVLSGACGNNLKNINLILPVGLFTCITGVSGSGKSTLINNTLFPAVQMRLNGASLIEPFPYSDIKGLEHFSRVINIDQTPIGRTPRSNPSTYTGIFVLIRDLFSKLPESRSRGYTPGRFSFNVHGGRCIACQGDGVLKVEMHFLPNIYVTCDQCKGKRYNRETLEIKYKGKTIHEVLDMTIEEAHNFFRPIPGIVKKLQTLIDVGLSYLRLGQPSTTLSGGEAQRIKLARELSKIGTGKTLYILDEPTTGLHFFDIHQLLNILQKLRNQGNTIVVIEHNLDVIKTADWIIDLGPEGGGDGGEIVVSGTPEMIVKCEASHTAQFLKSLL